MFLDKRKPAQIEAERRASELWSRFDSTAHAAMNPWEVINELVDALCMVDDRLRSLEATVAADRAFILKAQEAQGNHQDHIIPSP